MGFRYIGSKNKIVNIVASKIRSLVPKGSHIVDLMCGTATVSLYLRSEGYRVTAIDVMTYSFHHANVALFLSSAPSFDGANDFIEKYYKDKPSLFPPGNYEKVLNALENLPMKKGYFWNEFCAEGNPTNTNKPRNYFSPQNAKKIDSIRYQIKKLKFENKIKSIEHSLLLHDLIMAANDVANISGTYGHYLSKLIGRAIDPIRFKPTIFSVTRNHLKHMVFKGYAEDLAGQLKADLCYIDPPYMKRQYAANYHILETLAREDEPDAIGVSGLRPWRDQYSNFCTKTKIRKSFGKILLDMKCNNFLISYSQDGLLSLDELCSFLSKFGTVSVEAFKNKRFRSNQSKLKDELNEYLIHIKKQ